MKTKKVLHSYGDESSGDEAESEEEESVDTDLADTPDVEVGEGRNLATLSDKTLLCFFDLESTGLYSDREDCTQLAAKLVTLQDGKFENASAFNTYVKLREKSAPRPKESLESSHSVRRTRLCKRLQSSLTQ